MKARVFKSIENDVYQVLIQTEEFTEKEQQLMQEFGEPEINIGGTFLDATANEFTLPDSYVKIRSDFPYTQKFDSRDAAFSTNTSVKANAWKDAILDSINDSVTTLLATNDGFTGEEISNFPA